MDNFYEFGRTVDSSDYSYTFITKKNTAYSVELQGSTYQEYSDTFPKLMEYGYALVITRIAMVKPPDFKYDGKIKNTVGEILRTHFESFGKKTIVLYQCFDGDGMQRHRSIAFSQWFEYLNTDNSFIKESVSFEQDGEKTYLGYIASKENENIEAIKEEFNDFVKRKINVPK